MTTPLARLILQEIARNGPMDMAAYMAACLGHQEHGYYMHRAPFGRQGDFITAPDISQMFGELIGLWLAACWQAAGRPPDVHLIEAGPGRGTLMADLLRAVRTVPGFTTTLNVHLVETSPALTAIQQTTLADVKTPVTWHKDIAQVPSGFCLFVANELFDALPVSQLIMTTKGWRWRAICIDNSGALVLGHAPAQVPADQVPAWAHGAKPGDIAEVSPARCQLAASIASHIAASGGAGLIIDYGHAKPAIGDTLQAVRGHRYVPVTSRPGQSDLTAHVDFAALSQCMAGSGAALWPVITQRRFLLATGLRQRLAALTGKANGKAVEGLAGAADRLIGENAMGNLFKVLAITGKGLAAPPGFGP